MSAKHKDQTLDTHFIKQIDKTETDTTLEAIQYRYNSEVASYGSIDITVPFSSVFLS